jgi:uncharacterized protein (TIGR02996 family)
MLTTPPSSQEQAFLQAIVDDPGDDAVYLILADWLEEHDDPRRAELLRLHRRLLATCCVPDEHPERAEQQARLVQLLAEGVRPCVPRCSVDLGRGVAMVFTWLPPGSFLMGSPPDEEERESDETQHRVTLSRGFWLGVYPVTQAQWVAVMGSNPSTFKGDGHPVEMVSWDDCQEFCRRLSGRDGQRYRLPSEAQWEYACRAGTTTPFHFGATLSTELANYNGNYAYGQGGQGVYRGQTTPVGSFPSNAWGLDDMHGNVWQWCQDGYGRYTKSNKKILYYQVAGNTARCAAARGPTIRGGAARPAAAGARRPAAVTRPAAASCCAWAAAQRGRGWRPSLFSLPAPAIISGTAPHDPEDQGWMTTADARGSPWDAPILSRCRTQGGRR